MLKKFGKIYAIDIDKKALDLIPNNICFEKKIANVNDLPYSDNFFDLIVAFDVLEHIKKDSGAIKEIHRVLKKKGYFIFSVPAFPILFGSHDRALNHYRRYNKKTLKDDIKKSLQFKE